MNISGKSCKVLGLMSGTSLDGLDLAACIFHECNISNFEIVAAETVKYSEKFAERLKLANHVSVESLLILDHDFAKFCAEELLRFIEKTGFVPDLVSSHGHTVLHRPDLNYTLQIGNPGIIASLSGYVTVGDFRTQNVALGGQGAPLVPIGDALLFPQFDACLNLGGIANISFEMNNRRIAWDICVLNMALNNVANRLGFSFDEGGTIAAKGNVNERILSELNQLAYYAQPYPKSLGREWFESTMLPIMDRAMLPESDLMATLVAHQVFQLEKAIPANCKTILVTGGGAFNRYLIDKMRSIQRISWEVPDSLTINFKEALIFAFLGYRRLKSANNCLSSVTGSLRDHCSGGIYLP
jgi:anhydro-N-acetylmuramic acid kinase